MKHYGICKLSHINFDPDFNFCGVFSADVKVENDEEEFIFQIEFCDDIQQIMNDLIDLLAGKKEYDEVATCCGTIDVMFSKVENEHSLRVTTRLINDAVVIILDEDDTKAYIRCMGKEVGKVKSKLDSALKQDSYYKCIDLVDGKELLHKIATVSNPVIDEYVAETITLSKTYGEISEKTPIIITKDEVVEIRKSEWDEKLSNALELASKR